MSRPIKFRVWDFFTKSWLNNENRFAVSLSGGLMENFYFRDENCGDEFGFIEDYWTDSKENVAIQQFTGLKDKNGREIYEGDIYNLIGWSKNPYFCVWHEGEYWNRDTEDTDESFYRNKVGVPRDMRHTLSTHYKYAEIIGNIFETPELLEVKNG